VKVGDFEIVGRERLARLGIPGCDGGENGLQSIGKAELIAHFEF
jgi:hypothetical protein